MIYQHAGAVVLYSLASGLAIAGAITAWFALAVPVLDAPVTEADDPPADTSTAPLEPLG